MLTLNFFSLNCKVCQLQGRVKDLPFLILEIVTSDLVCPWWAGEPNLATGPGFPVQLIQEATLLEGAFEIPQSHKIRTESQKGLG